MRRRYVAAPDVACLISRRYQNLPCSHCRSVGGQSTAAANYFLKGSATLGDARGWPGKVASLHVRRAVYAKPSRVHTVTIDARSPRSLIGAIERKRACLGRSNAAALYRDVLLVETEDACARLEFESRILLSGEMTKPLFTR